jgi:hypothetical protein
MRRVQLGCLIALLLLALLGFYAEHFVPRGPPGNDEGGGPLGAIIAVGLILFFLVFGIAGAIEFFLSRARREAREFPVEPRLPPDEN